MAYLEEICSWAQRVKSDVGQNLGHIIINSELQTGGYHGHPHDGREGKNFDDLQSAIDYVNKNNL